jgi:hypothetical protein
MNQAKRQSIAPATQYTALTRAAIALTLTFAVVLGTAWIAFTIQQGSTNPGSHAGSVTVSTLNPGLMEFRRGERSVEGSQRLFDPNPALIEFRRGEQDSHVASSPSTPNRSLVEFRRGEHGN